MSPACFPTPCVSSCSSSASGRVEIAEAERALTHWAHGNLRLVEVGRAAEQAGANGVVRVCSEE